MEEVKIRKLDKPKMFKICDRIEEEIELGVKSFLLDFTRTSFYEPYAMVYFLSFVQRHRKENDITFEYTTNPNLNAFGYADFIGFFDFLENGENDFSQFEYRGKTYLPIHLITKKEIREYEHLNQLDMAQACSYFAHERTKFLLQGKKFEENVEKVLTYSIREIFRNVMEHSEAKEIWCAGQYWEKNDEVEMVILDEGVGIKNTLCKNYHIKDYINSDEDAIKFSLYPGLSGVAFERKGRRAPDYGYPDNSGYGLYVTSQICKNSGEFLIASGDTYLRMTPSKRKKRKIYHQGTAISLRLNLKELKDISISEIVEEGEKIAATSKYNSNKSASRLSKTL